MNGSGMRCRYRSFETKVRIVAGVLPISSASCSMNMTRGDPRSEAGKGRTSTSHRRAKARVGCRSPRVRAPCGWLANFRTDEAMQGRAYRNALSVSYAFGSRSRFLSYPFTDLTQRHQRHRDTGSKSVSRIALKNLE
ncbi:hypothetical protein XAC3218_590050 [Xanthomonas citri pv. citri]|nr:hypothetical protein XAC3824_520031 [Xanthomonas citri pv. citri]CEE86924.1 hypothetical protein XAC3218_590050 [Xanthomonas citri pv. citri]CEE87994.1 hypothetical protein XACLE20_890013 [Xanthomonas citri pv. citri]CEF24771.1 hypothetical protein XACJK2_750050 [Xanthomonas citri pv. citri]CEH43521.1 hypothetical protein XACJK48_4510004 [Xanthomonas citri pv. citri]